MSHKEFEAFNREQKKEPITFTVDGETFTCIQMLPLPMVEQVTQLAEGSAPVLTIRPFLMSVVIPEDHERLEKALNEPAEPIAVETWDEIVNWLLEEYNGRPTRRRSSSRGGSSLTGDSSRVASIGRT